MAVEPGLENRGNSEGKEGPVEGMDEGKAGDDADLVTHSTTAAAMKGLGITSVVSSKVNCGEVKVEEVVPVIRSRSTSTSNPNPNHNPTTKDTLVKGKDEGGGKNKDTIDDDTKLITDEERAAGSVGLNVYHFYFRHGAYYLIILTVLFVLGSQVSVTYSGFQLTDWGTENLKKTLISQYCKMTGYCDAQPMSTDENITYLNEYAWLMMVYLIGTCLRSVFTIQLGVNASRGMHRDLLTRVLAAPVSFFDTTPVGRILNRCVRAYDTTTLPVVTTLPCLLCITLFTLHLTSY